MKLSTQDRSFFGEDFKGKLTKIKELGFDGLEISGDVLIDRYDEIKKAVSETGVPISSICGGYRGWIGSFDEEERKKAITDIGEILRYTAELGISGVIVPAAYGMYSKKLPQSFTPRTAEEDRAVLLDSLDKINLVATDVGSALFLEPLNRYEDHMINRLEQAKSLITEGAFSSVKVLADFFHMNMEEADIASSISEVGSLIGHVHLADSNRQLPGLGHIDFESGFRRLKEIGFSGYMAIECELSTNPEKAYIESVNFLKSIIE